MSPIFALFEAWWESNKGALLFPSDDLSDDTIEAMKTVAFAAFIGGWNQAGDA